MFESNEGAKSLIRGIVHCGIHEGKTSEEIIKEVIPLCSAIPPDQLLLLIFQPLYLSDRGIEILDELNKHLPNAEQSILKMKVHLTIGKTKFPLTSRAYTYIQEYLEKYGEDFEILTLMLDYLIREDYDNYEKIKEVTEKIRKIKEERSLK